MAFFLEIAGAWWWANGLAHKIGHAIGARRASVPTNDVIYDDGGRLPCMRHAQPPTGLRRSSTCASHGSRRPKPGRLPKARRRHPKQVAAARATPGLTPSAASTQVRHRLLLPRRSSEVVAGDGASQCAADIIGAACRCGAHLRLDSHGSTADTMTAYCPQCFSLQ